jgi:hypothetical protein
MTTMNNATSPAVEATAMPAWVHLLVFSSGIDVLGYSAGALLLIALTRGRLSYSTEYQLSATTSAG